MNSYAFTKCNHCDEPIEVGGEGQPVIIAHGSKNADEVIQRIKNGEPLETIAKDFCRCCAGKMPCGCSDPNPQSGSATAKEIETEI